MIRPSAAIRITPEGEAKSLVTSVDAQACLDAYKNCSEPGVIFYIRRGHQEKYKKNKAAPVIKATRKRRADTTPKATTPSGHE